MTIKSFLITALLVLFGFSSGFSFTVKNLNATYRKGQVFLTWTNARHVNLEYRAYRSTTPFTSSTQLNATTYLGFVRDNSGRNFDRPEVLPVYFKITDNGEPLSLTEGLYVATSVSQGNFYYCIAVMDLEDSIEDKSIIPGQNTLTQSVSEHVDKPDPVLQDTIHCNGGEIKYHYVRFCDNLASSAVPAMNSTGSFGWNFWYASRGDAVGGPCYITLDNDPENIRNIDLDHALDNCWIIGFREYLPNHVLTFFSGWHENFNIYLDHNPVPKSGTVVLYTINRFVQDLRWIKSKVPLDKKRIYGTGHSAEGFGPSLFALLDPQDISAVYALVPPTRAQAQPQPSVWGSRPRNLNSSVVRHGDTIGIWDIINLKNLVHELKDENQLPLLFDVHGKNDTIVQWSKNVNLDWYDSLQTNHIGAICYFDQREHAKTNGACFDNAQTRPDYSRFLIDKAYPAFANCSINSDPGDGDPLSGDPYGTINGYLAWGDDITDNANNFSVRVFIKDLYVGTIALPKYDICSTDISFRRVQMFKPHVGDLINWQNKDASNETIQSGQFTYTGGIITLTGIVVQKAGNKIALKNSGNQRMGEPDAGTTSVTLYPDPASDQMSVNAINFEGNIKLEMTNSFGEMISTTNVESGSIISLDVKPLAAGIYFLKITDESGRSVSTKFIRE